MIKRFITGFILIGIGVPCLYFGGIAFDLLTLAVVIGACYELLKSLKADYPLGIKLAVYALFVLGWALACFASLDALLIGIGLSIIVLFSLAVWCEKVEIGQIGLIEIIYISVAMTLAALKSFYGSETPIFGILLVLIATYLTDANALFCGMLFGKHKLNERISPKKTIEGALGAYLLTTAICLLYVWLWKVPWTPFLILCCVLMPALGQLGDLAYSAIKRYYGIKDFGNIFPGHGGILDRIDSLTFNCILVVILIGLKL